MPWFALGLGSNLLFPDEGLDALVIRIGKGLDLVEKHGAALEYRRRDARSRWPRSGPRRPGGAGSTGWSACRAGRRRHLDERRLPRGRMARRRSAGAGCRRAGADHTILAADAGFDYRRSGLGRVVVLGTTVELAAADPARLEKETEALYKWRREATPFNLPCCGSVFKNPVLAAVPAKGQPRTSGQFIEATDLKGLRIGGIEVSTLHANYFVNVGGGTAADVVQLMVTVRQRVQERWGVSLEPEVKLINTVGRIVVL